MSEGYVSNFIDFRGRKLDIESNKVNNHTIQADVPSDAKYTDTTYSILNENSNNSNINYLVNLPTNITSAYLKQSCLDANGEWQVITPPSISQEDIDKAKERKSVKEKATNTVVFGSSATLSQLTNNNISIGQSNSSNTQHQFIVGKGSQSSPNSAFIVAKDKNIFSVEKDGNMKFIINTSASTSTDDGYLYQQINLLNEGGILE